ncbi:hypothetical protein TEU_07595 [Thermococcus eurythermalis]|uniref:Uncharacterized protein n=1 Tax=Thermococcus eurythermalis TaxID=1505907 RepID=A0A097QUP7_9EURY|nr:hypothetical protein [Thermococcus eurythermalis]AIU70205.1 hypothetical protein TEU_07595 [Thermococcus eurythermalis]
MAVPVVVNRDNVSGILQIVLYFLAFLMILYALYKLFGLFKDLGGNLEKKLNDLKNTLKDLDLNPSDAPGKFKETGEDIWTILKGTFTGEQNTPEYNKAMTDLHYGGPQWGPGTGFDTSKIKQGILKKYGQDIMPGETKVFAGGTYTETVVNNMVKCQYAGGEVLTKEDCLARKYGFMTYAQFNAWLEGVKARLKAMGKDPNAMSIDEIVEWGRKFENEKEKWKKQNPDKATPVLESWNNTVPSYLKQFELPMEKSDELLKKIYPKTPGGGIEIGYTPIEEIISRKKGLPKPIGKLPGWGDRHILPIDRPAYII